jgi:hypothetical protein
VRRILIFLDLLVTCCEISTTMVPSYRSLVRSSLALLFAAGVVAQLTKSETQPGADRIPWDWFIQPKDPAELAKCPAASRTQGMFAAVNVAGAATSFLAGNGASTSLITNALLGPQSQGWLATVPVQVLLHIISAFINAVLVSKTPGYTRVPVGHWAFSSSPDPG